MSNIDTGPYEEGRVAASDGERIGDNPYEKGTEEFVSWREGFKTFDEVDETDEEFEE